MRIEKLESTSSLSELKACYMRQTTAPLDGMWLCGYVPMASHFGFFEGDELVGFFCLNEERYLLQFFVNEKFQSRSSQLFESIFHEYCSKTGIINGAFVSTAEPYYLSLCLDRWSNFEVNTLMYQRDQRPVKKEQTIIPVDSTQLSQAVDFAVASIGAPGEWLSGYFANLIRRRELFGLWENGQLIATGESRRFDEYQSEYADIGVIVAQSKRGRGMATKVLNQLVVMNEANGLKSICSTEISNVAAQKAIDRAGFFASNRIILFSAQVK